MKLTIGMAAYDDFNGVYFTIQALRMYHGKALDFPAEVQLIVVDNSPASAHAKMTSNLLLKMNNGFASIKYVPMLEPQGTSPSRNRIFQEADGDIVLCMDSHVMLLPGALKTLLDYYDEHPGCKDLLSGPMMHDSFAQEQTHFDDMWRGEMWGTWGIAWSCPCGGVNFSVNDNNGVAYFRALTMGDVPVGSCYKCKTKFPVCNYAGYESTLVSQGFYPTAHKEAAFEIPGMGLGLFSCRRDAWLQFNTLARQFGGEELYIHEKYRQQGHKALCLSGLRWLHRFGRPDGVPYPLTRLHKIRNYVLEFLELGLDLKPVYDHFVGEGFMPEQEWNALLADPVTLEMDMGCSTCGGMKAVANTATSTEGAYLAACEKERDLNKHLPKLKELADSCPRICDISNRLESSIAFLASSATQLELHNTEGNNGLEKLVDMRHVERPGAKVVWTLADSTNVQTINECDMLFIDSEHTYDRLSEELRKFAPYVRRYIAMHDTEVHGKLGSDGGPGLLNALRDFMREFPEWSVVYHTNNQYGLTVIGCQKEDKPKMPSVLKMASNFAKAVAAHVADGAEKVTPEQLEERLLSCSSCDQRVDGRCAQCGCVLAVKAPMAVADCDLGRWPQL